MLVDAKMSMTNHSGNLSLVRVGEDYDKTRRGRMILEKCEYQLREEFLQRLYEAVECETADRVVEAGNAVKSTATFVMPDGSRVPGREASEEEWAEAANEYIERNLMKAGRALLEAVQFLEAEYYCRQR